MGTGPQCGHNDIDVDRDRHTHIYITDRLIISYACNRVFCKIYLGLDLAPARAPELWGSSYEAMGVWRDISSDEETVDSTADLGRVELNCKLEYTDCAQDFFQAAGPGAASVSS